MCALAITFLYLAYPVWLGLAALLLPVAEPVPHELLEVERCAPVRVHLLAPAVLVPGLRIRIHFIRIRIQHFRPNRYRSGSGSNTDPYPIRIQGFNDKKLTKKLQLKKKLNYFLGSKLQFTYP
jgi:hypothetical protein